MFSSYTIEEARKLICEKNSYGLNTEIVNIENSLGRIIAGDVVSGCNVPGFKRSIMDGYAVKHMDIAMASGDRPVVLKLIGEIEMGRETSINISNGECAYIPTGGMLPMGADSVLIIENTQRNKENIAAISCTKPFENVVSEDEDVAQGEIVIKRGKRIRPYEMGVLASIGYTEIEVFSKAKIGVLSTGDEIISPYEIPKIGQVRDINTSLLSGFIREMDCLPVIYKVKTDKYEEIYAEVIRAIEECDIVLISGGSSVGVKDYTLRVLQNIEGSEVLIHGLALKPGKPTIAAICDEKMVFGMPGHPLSCAVVFKTLVKYYLNHIRDYKEEEYPVICELETDYKKTMGREEYIPVVLEERDDSFFATPIIGKSGIITTFSKSYGYFKTSKETQRVVKGELVRVYRL